MAQIVSLAASPRTTTGKGAARQARFRGKVPAVIYGHGRETQSLEVEAKALEKALTGVEPASTIIELAVAGTKTRTLIREIQRHPIRPDIIHVDFYEIHAEEKVKLKVPVHLVRSEEHTSELQSPCNLVCRLLLEKKKTPTTVPPPGKRRRRCQKSRTRLLLGATPCRRRCSAVSRPRSGPLVGRCQVGTSAYLWPR